MASSDTGQPLDAEIPFIEVGDSKRSFGDIGAESAIDDPLRMAAGWRSMRNQVELAPDFEVAIGKDRSLPSTFLQVLAERRRCVGKISTSGVNYKQQNSTWTGTGFLVGKNLLLTNHHVLNSVDVAERAAVDFEFEQVQADFLSGLAEPPKTAGSAGKRFKLDPRRLFVTSPALGGGLDFTFVWIEEEASRIFGSIPMQRASFSVYDGEQAFVVHHPDGRARRVSLDDTEVVMINANVLRYTSDTMPGSSGSPVFDRQGRLIALHHASQRGSYKRQDGSTLDVANEGVKIAAIAIDLENRKHGPERDMIGHVLNAVKGSDTLSGFFGALGREEHSASAKTPAEAVVATYAGSDADLDVGFWNVGWLDDHYLDAGKLRTAAALVVDLGMHAWALTDVSANAVAALVAAIEKQFNEHYEYLVANDATPAGQRSTAVIWKHKTLLGERVPWPANIDKLWQAEDGSQDRKRRVFEVQPGLFRFRTRSDGNDSSFMLTPMLASRREADTRNDRVAAKLLAHAVRDMCSHQSETCDWLIGSTMDSNASTSALLMATATDDAGGAVSVIRSSGSRIDRLHLSPNLARQNGHALADVVVAKDKSVDSYARKLSDHRPALLRLTYGARDRVRQPSDSDIDAATSKILQATLGRAPALPARPTATPPRPTAAVGAYEASQYQLQTTNLTKRAFLETNRAELDRMIADVNARLTKVYEATAALVSLLDLAVLLNCEAGLKTGGKVDPEHRHSLGERGLFPLPSNVDFWNGDDAPDPHALMPVDVNVFHFLLYLGALKNKSIPSMPLYKAHFRHPGIAGDPTRQARLLAGIVHGYFVKANYGGRPIPRTVILDGYAADTPLPALMAGTYYVHAGEPLMVDRHRNIEAALGWVDAQTPADEASPESAQQPWQFLAYASDWPMLAMQLGLSLSGIDADDTDAVARKAIALVISKHPDKRALIGFDATSVDHGDLDGAVELARTRGAGLMIYVEGPGGPTGAAWAEDESARIRRAAASEGVDVSRPWSQWFKAWTAGPWQRFTFKQLARFKTAGFEAAEIDNLYQVVGTGDDATRLLRFFDDYRRGFEQGRLPRLILKNISGPQLERIEHAISSDRLTQDMFAGFHIAEADTGDPDAQREVAARIGIQTIRSEDTDRYTAFGAFDLSDA